MPNSPEVVREHVDRLSETQRSLNGLSDAVAKGAAADPALRLEGLQDRTEGRETPSSRDLALQAAAELDALPTTDTAARERVLRRLAVRTLESRRQAA